jgi:hypothetical protein
VSAKFHENRKGIESAKVFGRNDAVEVEEAFGRAEAMSMGEAQSQIEWQNWRFRRISEWNGEERSAMTSAGCPRKQRALRARTDFSPNRLQSGHY